MKKRITDPVEQLEALLTLGDDDMLEADYPKALIDQELREAGGDPERSVARARRSSRSSSPSAQRPRGRRLERSSGRNGRRRYRLPRRTFPRSHRCARRPLRSRTRKARSEHFDHGVDWLEAERRKLTEPSTNPMPLWRDFALALFARKVTTGDLQSASGIASFKDTLDNIIRTAPDRSTRSEHSPHDYCASVNLSDPQRSRA